MLFQVKEKNGRRYGKLTGRGKEIFFPHFFPDATRGYVRLLPFSHLQAAGIESLVVNTYHLHLQPGEDLIRRAGGIHKFLNWPGLIMSDSGGYQIFSLIHKSKLPGKIDDEKAVFVSPRDGKKCVFTPEKAIQIQFSLGVDIMVCLDDPCPNYYNYQQTKAAVERTLKWARRCQKEYWRQVKKRNLSAKERPFLLAVVQGGKYEKLREFCALELQKIGFDGYGFGGRHIDEKGRFLASLLEKTARALPKDSLRFALGIGTPADIVRCVKMGWDAFDCVIPTREGRHGRIFAWKRKNASWQGKGWETFNITRAACQNDFSSLTKNCPCPVCQNYNRAFLRHLFQTKDNLGPLLASWHNLYFYSQFFAKIRK